jgi:protein-S-isoprenylcysteine O-methyltransferase Ste14
MAAANGPPDGGTPGVIPPPVVFLIAIGAGECVQFTAPRSLFAHRTTGYAFGSVLMTLGIALSTWMSLHFRRAGTPVSPLRSSRRLVTSGPYRFSRNPDYIGQTLLAAGVALILDSPWPLLALVPAFFVVRYAVIAREERYLRARFGRDYHEYCRRVRRWL